MFDVLNKILDNLDEDLIANIPAVQQAWGAVWEELRRTMFSQTFKAIYRRHSMGDKVFINSKGQSSSFRGPM